MQTFVKATAGILCTMLLSQTTMAANERFGTGFTPARYPLSTDDDVLQALRENLALGAYTTYVWDWGASDDVDQLHDFVPLVRSVGLKPFLQISPTALGEASPPAGLVGRTFGDADVRARYLSDVDELAVLQPEYMNLAAEINLLAYRNPGQFTNYKSLYREAYARVKEISPNTKVGISLHMDLFFGDEQFTIMEDLPHDYVGFTSYPAWAVHEDYYESPTEMVTDYYDRIRVVFPKEDIVFTEMGWPSGGRGTLEEQAEFVRNLPRLLEGVRPDLVLWALQHDVGHYQVSNLTPEQIAIIENFGVDPNQLFDELNSTGLLSWAGPPKPAYFDALNLDLDFGNVGNIGTVIPEPASMSLLMLTGLLCRRARRFSHQPHH